jgi:hypothetical protein
MPIQAVFFDVGETLFAEARLWKGWAAHLGVSSKEFSAALDEIIARGEHHRKQLPEALARLDRNRAKP